MRKVGIYGWGVVAPRSPDIDTFARNLESTESWLTPFDGFGPDNFLVGRPDFELERYRGWIEERFPPNRVRQLESKMDPMVLYAVGSFIQSLEQNPGLEGVLTGLGSRAHVYIGTGLGSLPTIHEGVLGLDRAQFRWNRFWAHPDRCPPLAAWREGRREEGTAVDSPPADPAAFDDDVERVEAMRPWCAYWAARSPALREFLEELAAIEGVSIAGEVEAGKLKALRAKEKNKARLFERWGAPPAPWTEVSTNVLWNISNTPASQVSMLGHITGLAFAPVAACSTFGVALKLGMDAIRRGEADAVVIGATDPAPHPLSVGTFYNARVLSADRGVSKPLTGLRGTHVAGGAAVWVVGAREVMEKEHGFRPLGMEPLAVGVSSDADHIITPSREGPTAAIYQALEEGGVDPEELSNWDLHATATPGDFLEVETMRGVLPSDVLVTARKGTFGHGMAAGGGWELTAQYLGMARGELHPTPVTPEELNRGIREIHGGFVFDHPCRVVPGPVGKLSMGIGGVNACVVSRPL